MAWKASGTSEEKMWSGNGEHPMELDGIFDLDLVLVQPLLFLEEEISPSSEGILVPLPSPSSESESLVSNMPTVLSPPTDVCSVCMEELIPHHHHHPQLPPPTTQGGEEVGRGAAKQMPCGHVYHSSCISAWLSLRRSCPLCRHAPLSPLKPEAR